jgi:predicted RNase H-related nuclease YkuK (DUF458 family)
MKEEFQWKMNLFASFLASISVKTTLAPIERIKIFMQTDINNKRFLKQSSSSEMKSYITFIKVISNQHIFKQGGLFSFWNGNLTNLYRYSIQQMLMLSLKEYFYFHCR